MGLAISLVGTEKEKVWFYDKRKWQNKQLSTALAKVGKAGNPEGGGCCIWYDEPKLLVAVEKRMGSTSKGNDEEGSGAAATKIRELGPGYALPDGIEAAAYGEVRDSGGDGGSSGHVEQLQGAVEELKSLETSATISFYSLQQRFNGAATPGGCGKPPLLTQTAAGGDTQNAPGRGGGGGGGRGPKRGKK